MIMLTKRFHRFSLFHLSALIRHQTTMTKDDKKSKLSPEKAIRDQHLANITVTSFYCQSDIEQLALKVLYYLIQF